ncbi:MAG: hypothetical protein ACREOI_04905 [bacterium]
MHGSQCFLLPKSAACLEGVAVWVSAAPSAISKAANKTRRQRRCARRRIGLIENGAFHKITVLAKKITMIVETMTTPADLSLL